MMYWNRTSRIVEKLMVYTVGELILAVIGLQRLHYIRDGIGH